VSIREIARELYRLQKEIERIERILKSISPEGKKELGVKLKKIKAERDRVKSVLEGMKQSPDLRGSR